VSWFRAREAGTAAAWLPPTGLAGPGSPAGTRGVMTMKLGRSSLVVLGHLAGCSEGEPVEATPVAEPASLDAPPVVSGGTLLVTRDGSLAVAADSGDDAVYVVELQSGTLLDPIQLEAGDEPGRVVEDSIGRVHVALRRGGGVA